MDHLKFNSISDAHRAFGLPAPRHPLISVLSGGNRESDTTSCGPHILPFYKISYRGGLTGKLKYGQGYYDFDGGGLLFTAPNQIVGGGDEDSDPTNHSNYLMLIHPDFFLGHPIAKKIKQYGFFSYSANETLHLSDEERETILSIFKMVQTELNSRIDDLSQDVVISQIDLLLTFANRFYKRQFITRKVVNNDLLQRLEELLNDHFNNEDLLKQGVPTVAYVAEYLNLTPGYLSDMLRSLTGQSAQQHIHNKLIEKAKEILSTTRLSVSEVAYALGFEYSQSFSKLFKQKTNLSPVEFRQQFN